MTSSYEQLVAGYEDPLPPPGAIENYDEFVERSRFLIRAPDRSTESGAGPLAITICTTAERPDD